MCSNCDNVNKVFMLKVKNYLLNVGKMETGHDFKTGEDVVQLTFTPDQWRNLLESLDGFGDRSVDVCVAILTEEGSLEVGGEAWFCKTCGEAFEWGQGRAHSEVLTVQEYHERDYG